MSKRPKQQQTWRLLSVRRSHAFDEKKGRKAAEDVILHSHTNLLKCLWPCMVVHSSPINTVTLQALTIEHTCWSLLQRHQTPCRHTRLSPRIPTGGPAWLLLLTHTVACGERHFPDRCTHIYKRIYIKTQFHTIEQQ